MGISSKQFEDFSKGIDQYLRDTMIKDSETPFAQNVWATGKGSVTKRPGFVLAGTIATVNKISGIGTFYSNTDRKLIAMAGGKLWDCTGTPSQIGSTTWTADLATDFCQAAGKVFIQNGTNVLREYNGTAITDTTNGQIGKFSIFYKGCLWVAGDPSYPTRLYRSGTDTKVGDFTYNATTNVLATSVYIGKDDGQKITGLFKHQDYLYVLKENSIWSVTQGTDANGIIAIELVDPSRGCTNHRTIDSVDNDTFFFNDVGTFAFGYEPNITNQIRTNITSLRVDPKIKAIQKSRLDDVACIYFDNRYYLSYTSGGGTYNDKVLIYDRQRLGWWEFDSNISANCFTEYKDANGYSRLYYGSDTDGAIYYLDETAKTDNGTTVKGVWKSPRYSLGDYFQEKFFLQLMLYFGKKPGTITIDVYVEGKLHKTKNVVLGDTGAAGIGIGSIGTFSIGEEDGDLTIDDTGGSVPVKIPLNKSGRDFQVVITEDTATGGFELNSIEILFKPLSKIFQPSAK